MDKKRASEIVSSPVMADVTYNGIQIYIESISNDNQSAVIHPIDQPGDKKKVNLSSLTEHRLQY